METGDGGAAAHPGVGPGGLADTWRDLPQGGAELPLRVEAQHLCGPGLSRAHLHPVAAHETGPTELPDPPTDALTGAAINYHSSPDIVVLPVGTWTEPDPPNEADLHRIAKPTSFPKALHEAYVMVHHRHTTPMPGNDVAVNVFLHKSAPAGDLGAVSIDAAWRIAILETVRGNLPMGHKHARNDGF